MNQDIAETLGELERKLKALERTLSAIGNGEEASEPGPGGDDTGERWRAPASHSRLVDEAIEWDDAVEDSRSRPREQPVPDAPRPAPTPPVNAQGDPSPVFEASPASVAAAPATSEPPTPLGGGAPPPSAAELLHFRERLERVARELTDEYDDLLGRMSKEPARAPVGPTISFARGAPSLDIIDVEGLREAAASAFESDPEGTTAYGTSVGYTRLRAWIAERHGVEPERVVVTNGSLQADALLFDHLVRPRDEVVVERPTYDRTLLSLQQREARLRAVRLQPDGIDTDALAHLLDGNQGARPKLAHIIPNFQNPAGYTLSLQKRETLLGLAERYGFVVFEDDPYVALRFSGESLPTMLSMDPERVVYASSFSKTVCPGVRVGYLIGPTDIIDAVAQLATGTYISPSMVAQSIVYEFCASGAIERSITTVRSALSERAARLAAALRRELPDAEFLAPEGGYFIWVTLPEGTDVERLHGAAAKLGVSFVKGSDFVLKRGENTLRLAYAGVTVDQIDEGMARLAEAYRSL